MKKPMDQFGSVEIALLTKHRIAQDAKQGREK